MKRGDRKGDSHLGWKISLGEKMKRVSLGEWEVRLLWRKIHAHVWRLSMRNACMPIQYQSLELWRKHNYYYFFLPLARLQSTGGHRVSCWESLKILCAECHGRETPHIPRGPQRRSMQRFADGYSHPALTARRELASRQRRMRSTEVTGDQEQRGKKDVAVEGIWWERKSSGVAGVFNARYR